MNFFYKTCRKRSKTEQVNHHRILHIQNNQVIKFQLKLTIFNIWTQLIQKGYFWPKEEENENPHRFLHIRISLGSGFQLHQTILIFGNNFPKQIHFQTKTKKMNIITEFFIFDYQIFALNKQFLILGLNLPKTVIFGQKQKKWTSPLSSAYLK